MSTVSQECGKVCASGWRQGSPDQRQLLTLLHERWHAEEPSWNPTLGDEIEVALKRSEYSVL